MLHTSCLSLLCHYKHSTAGISTSEIVLQLLSIEWCFSMIICTPPSLSLDASLLQRYYQYYTLQILEIAPHVY